MRAQTQESVFPREVAAVVEGGAIVAVEGEAVVVVDEWEGLGISSKREVAASRLLSLARNK